VAGSKGKNKVLPKSQPIRKGKASKESKQSQAVVEPPRQTRGGRGHTQS